MVTGVGAGVAVADFLDRHEFRLPLLPAEALAGQAGDIAQRSEAELHRRAVFHGDALDRAAAGRNFLTEEGCVS